MPAPLKAAIYQSLKTALVTGADPLGPAGSTRRAILDINTTTGKPIPGKLPPAIDDLADALAEGIANQWLIWQGAQTVTGTAGPYPVVGILP